MAPTRSIRSRLRPLVALQLVALTVGCAAEAPPDTVEKSEEARVLLIGIDGVRPDVLAEVPTPNLDRLIREGAYTARARTGLPTVSGPGWSSMLIGVRPEKHGVHSNDFNGNAYDRYPDFLTRVEAWRPELETVAIADWLPLVAEDSGGPLMGDGPDRKHVIDGYDAGWREADSLLTAEAVRELSQGNPDVLFLYLGDPDETSHRTGSIGEEYRDAIATADRRVGQVMAALEARPGFAEENWLVLSSTDHGRTLDGGHGGETPEERTIYFLAWGEAVEPGEPAGPVEIVDVAVTALTHLGFPAGPEHDLDGRAVGLRSLAAGREMP